MIRGAAARTARREGTVDGNVLDRPPLAGGANFEYSIIKEEEREKPLESEAVVTVLPAGVQNRRLTRERAAPAKSWNVGPE